MTPTPEHRHRLNVGDGGWAARNQRMLEEIMLIPKYATDPDRDHMDKDTTTSGDDRTKEAYDTHE